MSSTVSAPSRHREYLERPLVGEYCTLRNATLDDAENIASWRNTVREAFFDTRLVTMEGTRQYLRGADGYHFLVEHEGYPCGYFGIYGIDEETGMAIVGRVFIQSEYRGRGIMTEARRLACLHTFMCTSTEKICGETRLDNPRAVRFAQSVGQELEGIRRRHFGADLIDGVVHGCFKDRYLEDFDPQAKRYCHPDPLSEMIRKFIENAESTGLGEI